MNIGHSQNKKVAGFTLIETLVAVLMLSVTLVAVTSLLTRALQATAESNQYLVASKIALEALEIVRVKRNANLLQDQPWNAGLLGNWEVDVTTANIFDGGNNVGAVYNGGTRRVLCLSPSNQYTYECDVTGATPLFGNYTRIVQISDVGGYSAEVTVTVDWGGTDTPPLVVSTLLFNAS